MKKIRVSDSSIPFDIVFSTLKTLLAGINHRASLRRSSPNSFSDSTRSYPPSDSLHQFNVESVHLRCKSPWK
ncbi:unnamed protein product, partial [Ilex paraguariensis]